MPAGVPPASQPGMDDRMGLRSSDFGGGHCDATKSGGAEENGGWCLASAILRSVFMRRHFLRATDWIGRLP